MSAPTMTFGPAVVGDGTTTRSRASSRWRRARFPLLLALLVAFVALLAALPEPRTSTTTLAPDNAAPDGARAVAQILGEQGVDVRYVRRVADAVSAAGPETTLLVVGDYLLDEDSVQALDDTGAELVLVDAGYALTLLTDQLDTSWDNGLREVRSARCDDPDAIAAGSVTARGGLVATGSRATVCFPGPDGLDAGGAYAVVDGEQRIAALADGTVLTNEYLADNGNAALALRVLGRHERLVWYIPSFDDAGTDQGVESGATSDLLPPVVPILALQLLLVVVATAVWRGRRFGRVVTEQMPVVVPGGETTRGRGRLYRRARSYGHAAAALRAGTATRCARRLGLARTSGPQVLIDAVALATGRPAQTVEGLLYGPPPSDDAALARLALELDHLESEVHRS